MANLECKGVDDVMKTLHQFEKRVDIPIGKANFDGAGYVADEVRKAIDSIPTIWSNRGAFLPYVPEGEKINGITKTQKNDLRHGLGIAKMRNDNGYYNVLVGFDGYGSIPTKKYPKGVPNQLLVRSLNKGTSFLEKNDAIQRAIRKSRKKAEEIMKTTFEKEAKKELNK